MERRRATSGTGFEEEFGYCRAVRAGSRVAVAGTGPVPKPGQALADNAHDQMLRCGEIGLGAMAALGASLADVVRTRMFITDPADANQIGLAHKIVFGEYPPAATMVVVAALVDPGWKIELEIDAEVADT